MGLYLGLISGTSMDAIDAVLADFDSFPLRVVAASATPFAPALKARIAAVVDAPDRVALDEIGRIDVELARSFAAAALTLLREAGVGSDRVAALGSHGQTLRHRPDLEPPFTWQIGDPSTLAELTGITVVADFRRRDVAAGGQGAPLLPVFHDHLFRSADEDRVILNLGGIANITVLKRRAAVTGFDTGPANRLLDAWISRHGGREFDEHGAWARSGRSNPALLARLLDEPYFKLPAPKSTGRELFNMGWLERKLEGAHLAAADVQATLLRLTARTVAAEVARQAPGAAIFACGGGAHNVALLEAIAREAAPSRVASTAELGLDPDYVEATAFAWFAQRTLAGLPSSAPSVTGAAGPRILGGVYRHA
ncbi:MAG TPA: anhydro-N-acetylmuramic acid kinase [Steroidobacteraceae bacterium]|jgi:anhydro-N-acetylmuramic acid kinase|nr:anhydro-N-acetylmuramic acid kinase [Steroidobacteraceae bacterium]